MGGEDLKENMGIEIPPEVIEREIVVYRNAVGDFFKNLGKGASVVATAGLMGWDGDTPTFGAWNSKIGERLVLTCACQIGTVIEAAQAFRTSCGVEVLRFRVDSFSDSIP